MIITKMLAITGLTLPQFPAVDFTSWKLGKMKMIFSGSRVFDGWQGK